MGFNRQIIKDNFERDVRAKIVETQQILNQLKGAISAVEKNSNTAKSELKNAVDTITQQLLNRQILLTQQIDLLSQPQIKSLQERIHSSCVTLGSLQSTLQNLDSFDFRQNINLVEPTPPWTENVNISLLKSEVETNVLTEEIRKWGNVKAKGLEHLTLQGSNSPAQLTLIRDPLVTLNKSFDGHQAPTPTTSTNPPCREPRDSQIEQWLCGMKIHSLSTESDDFEMIPEIEPVKSSENSNKMCSPMGNTCDVDKGSCCDGEDGSSIVCVESDEVAEPPITEEEMSKWLKPKKAKRTNDNNSNNSSDSSNCSRHSISSGTIQPYLYKSSKRNNTLDFPCLRLDPTTWIPKRQRNMVVGNNGKRQPELCLQMGQNEIIPPTYALPYPFWLKKY